MVRARLLAAVAVLVLLSSAVSAQSIVGIPRIIDGDTIVISGTHVRLESIDAPEHDQTCTNAAGSLYACGKVATEALRSLVGNEPVSCSSVGTDRYGRSLATCTNAAGVEINRAMVQGGFAVAYRQYSIAYAADEDAARAAKVGLWAGSFEAPWEWRKTHPVHGYSHNYTHSYGYVGPPHTFVPYTGR